MLKRFTRTVRPSYRYRLNRLADTLVTCERYRMLSNEDLLALLSMPKITVEEANAEVKAMVAEANCPYGNPNCNLPDAPMGHGLHRPCYEREYRRYVVDGRLTDGEAALIWSSNA